MKVAISVVLVSLVASVTAFGQSEDAVVERLVQRGSELFKDNYTNASLAVFDVALEMDPDHHAALAYRAQALADNGEYEEAKSVAHRAHEMESNRLSLETLARVYYEEEDHEKAAPYFDEALAYGGNDTMFVGIAGINDYYADNPNRAIDRISQAIDEDPEDYLWFWWRGEIYWDIGKLGLALPDYDEAVMLNPDDDGLIADRGDLKYELGDLDGAYEDFNRAVELEPEYEWAWTRLIQIQTERGNYFAMLDDSDRYAAATGTMTNPPKFLIYFSIGFVVIAMVGGSFFVALIAGLLIWHQGRMKTIQTTEPPPMRS